MGDRDEPTQEQKIQRSEIVRRSEPFPRCGGKAERGLPSPYRKSGSEIFRDGGSGCPESPQERISEFEVSDPFLIETQLGPV